MFQRELKIITQDPEVRSCIEYTVQFLPGYKISECQIILF